MGLLYKFRSIDKNLFMSLLDSYIYAANPITFNDPFEGYIDIDLNAAIVSEGLAMKLPDMAIVKDGDPEQYKSIIDSVNNKSRDMLRGRVKNYLYDKGVACFGGTTKVN